MAEVEKTKKIKKNPDDLVKVLVKKKDEYSRIYRGKTVYMLEKILNKFKKPWGLTHRDIVYAKREAEAEINGN